MPKNLDQFHHCAGLLLAALYAEFPKRQILDLWSLHNETAPRPRMNAQLMREEPWATFEATLHYLNEEGYIRLDLPIVDGYVRNIRLSDKGLAALHKPINLDHAARETVGDKIYHYAQSGMTDAAREGLRQLIRILISG
jgi:hypothetical protein